MRMRVRMQALYKDNNNTTTLQQEQQLKRGIETKCKMAFIHAICIVCGTTTNSTTCAIETLAQPDRKTESEREREIPEPIDPPTTCHTLIVLNCFSSSSSSFLQWHLAPLAGIKSNFDFKS